MGGYIRLVTEVPGPASRRIMERLGRAVPRAVSVLAPVAVARAFGALVTDVDGNTYIDLSGGVGTVNAGHAPAPVVEAVREQAGRFLHTDFSVLPYEAYVELAERLAAVVPGPPGEKRACFFNSGAEAVENAVKFARAFTKRRALIAFEGAFHGRTALALALTSKARPYKEGLGPLVPEVHRVPFAYCYRCPFGRKEADCALECAEALERALVTHVAPSEVAAVIFEPVQGEGGFVVPPPGFLGRVQEICRRHGILLVADEIQTGFGRTGRLFAGERLGIEPDLVCLAKSLAAGLPLSAVVGRADVMDAAAEGNVGGTYVGNPLACAAALRVLDLMASERLPERAERLGALLMDRLRAMRDRYPLIGDVRGLGAMVGIELVKDRETKAPAAAETRRVLAEALRRGVIAVPCGIYGNVIRFLNPLNIHEDMLSEALDALEEAVAAVQGG